MAKAPPPIDPYELAAQWRQFSTDWATVDPAQSQRFARLAHQMQQIIDEGGCNLAPPKTLSVEVMRQDRDKALAPPPPIKRRRRSLNIEP